MQNPALKLTQLLGIIQYELKLQWRRRSMLVIALSFIVIMFGALILNRETNVDASQEATTVFSLLFFAPVGLLLAILTFPAVVAETLPRDHQYKVAEILDALPFSFPFYLLGKLLGVWASILLLLTGFAVLQWVGSLLLLGPVDLWMFLKAWLMVIAPMSVVVTGLSVLLSSGVDSRRRATFVGGIITMVTIISYPLSIMFQSIEDNWAFAFSPFAWLQILFGFLHDYILATTGQPFNDGAFPAPTPPELIWRTPLAGIIQLVLVGGIVLGWHHYKKNKN